jgi:hypothetical protein
MRLPKVRIGTLMLVVILVATAFWAGMLAERSRSLPPGSAVNRAQWFFRNAGR